MTILSNPLRQKKKKQMALVIIKLEFYKRRDTVRSWQTTQQRQPFQADEYSTHSNVCIMQKLRFSRWPAYRVWFPILKMEVETTSETVVTTFETTKVITQRNIIYIIGFDISLYCIRLNTKYVVLGIFPDTMSCTL
jgi:hypothetical protein